MHPATTALVAAVRAADRLSPAVAGGSPCRCSVGAARAARAARRPRRARARGARHDHRARARDRHLLVGQRPETCSWCTAGAVARRSSLRSCASSAPRATGSSASTRPRTATPRAAHRHPRLPGRDRRAAAAPRDVPRGHRALVRRPGRAHRRARGHRGRGRGGDRRHGRRPVPGRLVRRAGRRGLCDRRRARQRVARRVVPDIPGPCARPRRTPGRCPPTCRCSRARPRRPRGRGIRVAATARRPWRALAPRAHRRGRSRSRARRRRDARRGDGVRHGGLGRSTGRDSARRVLPAASA